MEAIGGHLLNEVSQIQKEKAACFLSYVGIDTIQIQAIL
jgi:hypothetical protein